MTEVESEREVTAGDISETDKFEFLQMIRQGMNPQEASRALGHKPRHFRSLRSPQSRYFDEEFKNDFEEANNSFEHADAELERLRAEVWRRAMLDSDRLIEKLSLIKDPEWEVLRQKDVNVNVQVLVQRVFKDLPTEQLRQILAWVQAHEGGEITEAEFSELPSGNAD
jgi:hypothetical protein